MASTRRRSTAWVPIGGVVALTLTPQIPSPPAATVGIPIATEPPAAFDFDRAARLDQQWMFVTAHDHTPPTGSGGVRIGLAGATNGGGIDLRGCW